MAKTIHPVIQGIEAKNFEVKKHVATIHTSGDLTSLQRRLNNVLLLQAYEDLLTKREHSMPLTTLMAMLEWNSNDVGTLKEALRELRSCQLELNLMGDAGKRAWTITGLLAEAAIENGTVYWSYSPRWAQEMYDPEVYARINVHIQNRFTSVFTLNLHENCYRYKAVGSTGWWDVDKFRRLIGATAARYDVFAHLNNKVIKPSVAEVNEFGDIHLTAEYERARKKGTPVIAVRFRISESVQQQALFAPAVSDGLEAVRVRDSYKALIDLGLADKLAIVTVQNKGDEWCLACAKYTKERYLAKQARNPRAYATSLIKANAQFGPSPLEVRAAEKSSIDKQRLEAARLQELKREAREKARLEFEAERKRKILDALSFDGRLALAKAYLDSCEPSRALKAKQAFDPATAKFTRAIEQGAFEHFIVRRQAGDYNEADLDAWIAERRKQPLLTASAA